MRQGNNILLLLKAQIANNPGLHLEDVTDKAGHRTKRWKRSGQDEPKPGRERQPKRDPEDVRGSKRGYGTHHIDVGDTVKFETPDHAGEGQVVSHGKDGATVRIAEGREHKVLWSEVRHHKQGGSSVGAKKVAHDDVPKVLGKQQPITPENFKAEDYAKSHDQADVSVESILSQFPSDTHEKIKAAQARLASIEQTIDAYRKNGEWSDARKVLHQKIFDQIIPPELEAAAKPPEGEKPTFIILGGRGGSGKSSFKGLVYDPSKCVVLDADHIKGLLPEYEGWNAHQVHEESGEIFDNLAAYCRNRGLNVVLDKTMKTAKSAVADVQSFKDAGYRTEAHYMHLPRQESAKRAVARFLNGGVSGRYVPPEVILGNTTNEASFDQVKHLVDAWSFRDNNVARGASPILISEHGKLLKKSSGLPIILVWRKPL